jgi:hypothetical protein
MVCYLSSPISMVSIKDYTISQKKKEPLNMRGAHVKKLVIIIVIFTSLIINYVLFLFFNVGNHSFQTTYKIKIKIDFFSN